MLDAGIGDIFVARIAGNIANDNLIGSLEFACAAGGALQVLAHARSDFPAALRRARSSASDWSNA